jgi:hypothetical protein
VSAQHPLIRASLSDSIDTWTVVIVSRVLMEQDRPRTSHRLSRHTSVAGLGCARRQPRPRQEVIEMTQASAGLDSSLAVLTQLPARADQKIAERGLWGGVRGWPA